MTPEQLRQCGEAMIAASQGKPVEAAYRSDKPPVWWKMADPSWNLASCLYRPAPVPCVKKGQP